MFKKGYSTLQGFVILAMLTTAVIMGVEIPMENFPVSEEMALLMTSILFGIGNRFRTTTAVGDDSG